MKPSFGTSPTRLGLAISGVLVTALLVSEHALGRLQILLAAGDIRDLRIAVVLCLLVGYLPAAYLYAVRGARVTILALRPALECDQAELDELAQSAGRFGRRGLMIAGLIGLLVSLSGPYLVPPVVPAPWDPRTWSPEVAWHRALGPVFGWFLGWVGCALLEESGRLSRLAGRLAPIDLFDLRPLAPSPCLAYSSWIRDSVCCSPSLGPPR